MDTLTTRPALAETYQAIPGVFDEMTSPDGGLRPEWRQVLAFFEGMSAEERLAAADRLRRVLHENQVTFVAQGDADRAQRPWQVDLFPLLVAPDEWRQLAAGLVQRARLLNEILLDVYGDQQALRQGALPAGIVFGSRQFLRPCSGIVPKSRCHLHLIAFDLARGPDGRWWVLSDRAEAPSGMGYTLENRIVTARILPALFGQLNVERHARFFQAFNEHLLSLTARDEPLAVLLSRGPAKRTYFEHAYLARYLGYTVVEGCDLVVRNNRVFLKTIEGLKPIDLVVRTVRSDMCDPLEMRSDSLIGVPGLLQAARAGGVVLANSLGSGLVENDALLSFLPSLCRFYLAEDLAIPSVATWWCGQPSERDYVIDNLDRLVVRQISTTRSFLVGEQHGRVEPGSIRENREAVVEQIRRNAYDFIGQESVGLSTAPMWSDAGTLKTARVTLRVFVAATAGGYQVLPGGLTRISIDADPRDSWLAESEVSKDTWVLSETPVDQMSLLAQPERAWLRRSSGNLPSRAADNLFWLGRYTERAEAAVRLFRGLVIRLHGEADATRRIVRPERLVSLLVLNKHMTARRGKLAVQQGREAVERELWRVLFDADSRDGLTTLLRNVHRNAEAVRERLSGDAIRILADLADLPWRAVRSASQEAESAVQLLNESMQQLLAFGGLVNENMTRGDGWRFLDLGRRMERLRTLVLLVRELAVKGHPDQDGGLELLLELADSTMTYLGRYYSRPQVARVLDLVLCDESNPRSMLFQVATINEHLKTLKRTTEADLLGPDQRIATRLESELRLVDPFALDTVAARSRARERLSRLLRELESGLESLTDLVSRYFFSHSIAQRISATERRREAR